MNKVHHGDFLNNGLSDKSVQLIIADPPYFEVKGHFDFIWKSFDDYLKDVEKWAVECKRILADNGSLFWWGHAKKIAYTQIILDKYFNLENSLIWRKIDSMQYQYYSIELSRSFNTHNERLLFYSNEVGMTGREFIEQEYIKPKNPFSIYLKSEFEKAGVTIKEIAKLFPSKTGGLTGCVSNWLNGDNIITEEQYLKVREYFNNKYLRREYKYLRREYEDLRRPFNNVLKLEDVLTYSQQSHKSKDHDHETVKPEKLTEDLIQATTRKNDIVFIPFAGSGTECAMSAKTGRRFIAYDIEKKYVNMANKRVSHHLKQGALF